MNMYVTPYSSRLTRVRGVHIAGGDRGWLSKLMRAGRLLKIKKARQGLLNNCTVEHIAFVCPSLVRGSVNSITLGFLSNISNLQFITRGMISDFLYSIA